MPHFVPDRDLDAGLAAVHEVYGLMLAARREPGEWVARAFPAGQLERVVERAQHEGFEVEHLGHGTAAGVLETIRVRTAK